MEKIVPQLGAFVKKNVKIDRVVNWGNRVTKRIV